MKEITYKTYRVRLVGEVIVVATSDREACHQAQTAAMKSYGLIYVTTCEEDFYGPQPFQPKEQLQILPAPQYQEQTDQPELKADKEL